MRAFVTGGCGFVGSALVRRLVADKNNVVLNFDALTYAADQRSLESISSQDNYQFFHGDIRDRAQFASAFTSFQPDVVLHLAAESHVDRSISGPGEFLQTNIFGTFIILETVRDWLDDRTSAAVDDFRLIHVSTDEVFGDLGPDDLAFSETSAYRPSSPYSASKAASDHLVKSWHRTYGIPAIITNCSNNYGPYQLPEKLIPLMILAAISDGFLPVYGEGLNIRDWLHVDDHVDALITIARLGDTGENFNIGGGCERRNIDVIHSICRILDMIKPKPTGNYSDQITFVKDRPGHDRRYAIDGKHLAERLGWRPRHNFESGLEATVRWYLENEKWWRPYFESKAT